MEKDKSIAQYNEQVLYLSNILLDIFNMSYAPLYLDPLNTRVIYPEIQHEFSEKTIFKTFIYYCKFTTNLPIDDELRAICLERPSDILPTMSIDEQIQQLKLNGRNFTLENLNELILYISKNNIINISFNNIIPRNFVILKDILEYFEESQSNIFPQSLTSKLLFLLDSYDLSYEEDTEEIRILKNYLVKQNDLSEEFIFEFMKKNSRLNKKKIIDLMDCLHNISDFKNNNINNSISIMLNFMKNNIYNLISVFPNIILNEIDYENIMIPRHWDLSEKHNSDIKIIIKQYYGNLSSLYGDQQIKLIFDKIQKNCKDILTLLNNLFYQVNIFQNDKELHYVLDSKIFINLIKYCFNSTILEYINLSKNLVIIKYSNDESDKVFIEPESLDDADPDDLMKALMMKKNYYR